MFLQSEILLEIALFPGLIIILDDEQRKCVATIHALANSYRTFAYFKPDDSGSTLHTVTTRVSWFISPFCNHIFRQRGYTKLIYTEKDRISYYVQPERFDADFPKGSKERAKVERQVKQDYIEVLRNNCYQETLNGKTRLKSTVTNRL